MPKIFISYRRIDSSILATHLDVTLKPFGIDAFVDTRNTDGGGPFPNRLRRAIEECDIFVCLLGATTLESDWVRKEIEYAHNLAKVFIPVFQERYIAPDPIPDDHVEALLQSDGVYILDVRNLYIDAAISELAKIINKTPLNTLPPAGRVGIYGDLVVKKISASDKAVSSPFKMELEQLTADILKILPPPFEWCFVPSGNVTLETDTPKTYTIADFAIAKYTITNIQFQVFVEARDGYMYEDYYHWYDFSSAARGYRSRNPKPQSTVVDGDNLPRTNMRWYDAIAFCRWLGNHVNQSIALPTEQQWQRAAIGDTGWKYPWGNEFVSDCCCFKNNSNGKSVSVTAYENGASPYGVVQMSGNVSEWCSTDYENPDQSDVKLSATYRAVRGGSFNDTQDLACASYRSSSIPEHGHFNRGFRVAFNLQFP